MSDKEDEFVSSQLSQEYDTQSSETYNDDLTSIKTDSTWKQWTEIMEKQNLDPTVVIGIKKIEKQGEQQQNIISGFLNIIANGLSKKSEEASQISNITEGSVLVEKGSPMFDLFNNSIKYFSTIYLGHYNDLKEKVREVLKTLTPREEKVLKMRFGIDVASEHTLEEVGKDFSVTRERIRQIEVKALKKLKHPSRSKKLLAFFEKDLKTIIEDHEEDIEDFDDDSDSDE